MAGRAINEKKIRGYKGKQRRRGNKSRRWPGVALARGPFALNATGKNDDVRQERLRQLEKETTPIRDSIRDPLVS